MLDYTKQYKRIFAFGCSFTNYSYPTWANLISFSYPRSDFYNFAKSGGGNFFISSRIAEANNKFKFDESDLILVMWSTFCREDRYVNDNWLIPGNIFTQNTYDDKFVKKFSDPKGYLIKDLSLIELTTNYLNSIPSDKLMLISVPFNYQMEDVKESNDIISNYKNLTGIFPPSLFELGMNNTWSQELEFYYDWNPKTKTYDYHPHTLDYANYLNKLGLNLPDKTLNYARMSLEKTKKTLYFRDLDRVFNYMHTDSVKKNILLW